MRHSPLFAPNSPPSIYAVYPFPDEYKSKWLSPYDMCDKNLCFIASEEDQGKKQHYVYCKRGPLGKGYYHVLTKVAYSNLYTRLQSEGSGVVCGCLAGSKAKKRAEQWDTARRLVYNRCRCSRPDDEAAAVQAIDHMGFGY